MVNYGGNPPVAPETAGQVVSPVSGIASSLFRCIIDTGAGITCVPAKAIKELGPGLDYRILKVSSAVGDERRRVFVIHLRVKRCDFLDLEVVSIDMPFGLIGRDVLNNYKLFLDGIGKIWRVESDASC